MSLSFRVALPLLLPAVWIGAATAAEREGPFVALDLKLVQPTGVQSDYTILDADDDFEPEGPVVGPEFSKEFSPEIHLGYEFPGGRGIAASYWSFDERETDRRQSPEDGSLWDILFAASWGLGPFEGSADAELTVEAERLDVVYYWRVARRERVELRWKAGVRYASFGRELRVVYDDLFDPERVFQSAETEGIGVVAAVESRIGLGKRWSLFGGATLGFLEGETESSNLNDWTSQPDEPILDVDRAESLTFSMIELECGVLWHVNDRFDVALGYEFGSWNDVLTREFFADDWNPGFMQGDSGDVSWGGATVGLGVSF